LLLKEIQKYCNQSDKSYVENALSVMLNLVRNLNDLMHASLIDGLSEIKSLGRLLKRDQLKLVKRNKRINATMKFFKRLTLKESSVELFLFEKSFIICKRILTASNQIKYHLKESLKVILFILLINSRKFY
jgi:hypothetical protein